MTTIYAFEPAPDHQLAGHPEHPDRLNLIQPRLSQLRVSRLEGRAAGEAEVLRVHKKALLDSLVDACLQNEAIIDLAPTYVRNRSLQLALQAAGATIECAQRVWRGEADNAFSIVRPPGHHAEPGKSMGFCLLNNVAIAAEAALADGAQRVAIIDYDAHHGNGTQSAVLADERVAFMSIHQWGIYPGTGWYEEAPGARARLINVPLPARSGDTTYGRLAEGLVAPLLRAFRPDMMLVSAGFDAHWTDPLTALGLSSAGFHALSQRLVEFAEEYCRGRILFVLEGGYDPINVANGALGVFAALTGGPFADPGDACPHPEPEPDDLIATIQRLHGFGK